MQYTSLGATGLRVSVAGLGCGGNSRLGLGRGKSEAQAIKLVHAALELGVTFFDTAETYGTEAVLGKALAAAPRERVVISSKSHILDDRGNPLPSAAVVRNLERSLERLSTDHIDVFHLHAVPPRHYDYALEELAPALLREKQRGKIRHLGITETPPRDPDQAMLTRALDDPCWEVVMLAFHMMNQRARQTVFPRTQAQGVGTLLMFVVRNIFSRASALHAQLAQLAHAGKVPPALAHDTDPLDFLIREGGASSVIDAAYRFARHEPGADVILFGTSEEAHLRANVASILKPPLATPAVDKLRALFGHLRGVGLDLPDYLRGPGASPAF